MKTDNMRVFVRESASDVEPFRDKKKLLKRYEENKEVPEVKNIGWNIAATKIPQFNSQGEVKGFTRHDDQKSVTVQLEPETILRDMDETKRYSVFIEAKNEHGVMMVMGLMMLKKRRVEDQEDSYCLSGIYREGAYVLPWTRR